MLSQHDQVIIEGIVDRVVTKRIDRVEIKIDKVLKIVTRTDQEHKLTQTKVNKLEKRTAKIERKLKMPPPSTSVIFA